MKNSIYTFLIVTLLQNWALGQSVSIDPSNTINSIIEIKSTNQGIKTSRLSCSQVIGINNPPEGLLVYNTSSHLFNYFNGNSWRNMDGSPIASATNVEGVVSGTNTIGLTINTATLSNSVNGAVSYNVNYKTVGGVIWNTASTNSNSIMLNSLNSSSNYEWQVQAVTPCGTTAYSNLNTFFVPSSNVTITTNGFSFSPSTVTIVNGGTITWSFNMSAHPFSSGTPQNPTNQFGSSTGTLYTYTFTQAGTYKYYCLFHNDIGTIIVQ